MNHHWDLGMPSARVRHSPDRSRLGLLYEAQTWKQKSVCHESSMVRRHMLVSLDWLKQISSVHQHSSIQSIGADRQPAEPVNYVREHHKSVRAPRATLWYGSGGPLRIEIVPRGGGRMKQSYVRRLIRSVH